MELEIYVKLKENYPLCEFCREKLTQKESFDLKDVNAKAVNCECPECGTPYLLIDKSTLPSKIVEEFKKNEVYIITTPFSDIEDEAWGERRFT